MFEVYERGHTIYVNLPPQSLQVIQINKKAELDYQAPAFYDRPDLAIGDQGVFIGKTLSEVGMALDGKDWIRPWETAEVRRAERIPVTIIIHNLGKQSDEPAIVKLMYNRQGNWVEVDQQTIFSFVSSDDLDPGKAIIELGWKPIGIGEYQLIVQVEYKNPQLEINHRNNILVKRVKVKPR